jgi:hypothetical protein
VLSFRFLLFFLSSLGILVASKGFRKEDVTRTDTNDNSSSLCLRLPMIERIG